MVKDIIPVVNRIFECNNACESELKPCLIIIDNPDCKPRLCVYDTELKVVWNELTEKIEGKLTE